MGDTLAESFTTPIINIWESELGETVDKKASNPADVLYDASAIIAVVGVTGKLSGDVLYGFTQETAMAIASKMMGEPLEALDEMALSAICELANMITGNAATLLAEAGMACEINAPVLMYHTELAMCS
ncbi:MAG: chemotaxis protein CheX, partial [Chloroflexi bacterium]|nr:chemotaxis protein CheX [Chloroflexota bacterium]